MARTSLKDILVKNTVVYDIDKKLEWRLEARPAKGVNGTKGPAAVSLNVYLLNQETQLRASGRCGMEGGKERDIGIVKDAFNSFAHILTSDRHQKKPQKNIPSSIIQWPSVKLCVCQCF